jgi:Transposase
VVELVHPRCAGLDVAKDEVVACVRVPDGRGGRAQEVRTFPTFTSGLEALAGWLAGEGVTQVVLEATGQYWKPIWYVLEEAGFELMLVNARHVKILPGRKTDVCDAAWLAELLEHGLLRGSFVPPAAIRQLRDLTRYRKRLIQTHSAECQRIQKTLEDAGIKLDSVATYVLGPRVGRCSARWLPGSATLGCWPSWLRAGCGPSSPSCARPCGAGSGTITPCWCAWPLSTWRSWRPRSLNSTPTSTGCWPRSLRPGTGWTPSPGWASARPSASSPRSASTCPCSPPPATWRRGRAAARATTSPAADAAPASRPGATAGWVRC